MPPSSQPFDPSLLTPSPTAVKKVLIYMTGSLGDTLALLPALWAIRDHWTTAQIALLSDRAPEPAVVKPEQVLRGAGLVDDFFQYPSGGGQGRLWQKLQTASALWRLLRDQQPEVLVYLARAWPGEMRLRRDKLFFQSCGVQTLLGFNGLRHSHPTNAANHLDAPSPATRPQPLRRAVRPSPPTRPRIADLHLGQLAADGIPVPDPGTGRMDLAFHEADRQQFQAWREKLQPDGARPWVGFGVGSKRQRKVWPLENFAAVGRGLIQRLDIWPVVFGGAGEREPALRLVSGWGRGHIAAGELGVRAAALGLRNCALFVGNDSGTLHLAAVAGTRCVGVFSAREREGLWEPYGTGHTILRPEIPCAKCTGECPRQEECLRTIQPSGVLLECMRKLV